MQLEKTREALNKFAKFVIQQARTRLTKGVKKGSKRFSKNDTRKLYNSLEYLPFIDEYISKGYKSKYVFY